MIANTFKLMLAVIFLLIFQASTQSQQLINHQKIKASAAKIVVAAERTDNYFRILKSKKIAVVANQTSLIKNTHLVDSLLKSGIEVKKVFCPEHGFRGDADAGEKVKNYIDKKTQLSIISLYGSNKKPTAEDLKDIDIVVFDMQDVGARFYTYISTMHYVMEACAESKIMFMVLDRPNPNGHFVDGPMLEEKNKSFVGMHPVPVVHGMTIGEYAKMINGEGWLASGIKCNLKVVECENYTHFSYYELPVKPSPNLPNMSACYLYPSLCLFEGTVVSVGRGTDKPFQQIGNPEFKKMEYSFTPKSTTGAKNPPFKNSKCYGYDLSDYGKKIMPFEKKINLYWLISCYQMYPEKTKFFNSFFINLAGTDKLKEQIESGITEEKIRETWQPQLLNFKEIRKKYLLYTDFE